MASNLKLSNAAVNASADAKAALLNGGFIDIYDGAQPATADTAVGAQTKLARLTFGNPAFAAAVAGVATANPITQDSSADAGATPTWFRALTSGGAAVMDGTVGTSGCDCNINAVPIVAGAVVSCTGMTITDPKSA